VNPAQLTRFAITFAAIMAAGAAFMLLDSGWGWLAALAMFFAVGAVADLAFRRLATEAAIAEDLGGRVRNPD
jgi:hypothetical protein